MKTLGNPITNFIKMNANAVHLYVDETPIIAQYSGIAVSCQIDDAPTICGVKDYQTHREGLEAVLKKFPTIEPVDPLLAVLEKDDGKHAYIIKFKNIKENATFKL